MDALALTITIIAALLSGLATGVVANIRDHKKEIRRRVEKEQDLLKLDLKDLEIKLYKVEKDLDEWKNKYYETLQELIEVKAELEKALINLTHIVHHED
jgi:peptidoglycan hydrolase CwlO-like protein